LAGEGGRVLLLTYTINNQEELMRHICRLNKFKPGNIVVKGWFSFLLEDMIRPYQRCIVPARVAGIFFNPSNPHLRNGFSLRGRKEEVDGRYNPLHYVTKGDCNAHTYFLAKLAARIHEVTGGRAAKRLSEIYKGVFIDEVQDLVGWDYQVIKAVSETDIADIKCVGDFRQTIYRTTVTPKGPQTDEQKLAAFADMGFEREELNISWRCLQSICDLADRLHADDGHYAPTQSQLNEVPQAFADHHGVFAVQPGHMDDYIVRYKPVILRWSRRTNPEFCDGQTVYNFGESKGLGFERVLILPTDKHSKFLSGDSSAFLDEVTDDSRNRLYVGVTRARYSVAFKHEGGSVIHGAQVWNPE